MGRDGDRPWVRVAGSALSWVLFTLSFILLFRAGAIVIGLGGSCASGGPYVVETECPDSVALFAPLSIFGGLVAVAAALVIARGFGTPLVVWSWPVLFAGLGIDFLAAAFSPDGAANLVVAIVFLAMGLIPLVIVLRAGLARNIVGTTDAHDRPFRDTRRPTPILGIGGRGASNAARPASAGDWALALGTTSASIALGAWLAQLLFAAATAAAR